MNSLIACNSYKSKVWPRRESFGVHTATSGGAHQGAQGFSLGPYSLSYGTVEAPIPPQRSQRSQRAQRHNQYNTEAL